MSSPPPTNVGIDVANATLDIAVHETQTHWTSRHDLLEFPELAAKLAALSPSRIVLEASGGCEELLAGYLAAAGLPVIVINPRQVRDFAGAIGQRAKTDRIDALVLARFAAVVAPPIRPLKAQETQLLEQQVARRDNLVQMLLAERLRLQQAQRRLHHKSIIADLQHHITYLEQRLDHVDEEITKFVRASPLWKETDKRLQTVPGVGPTTSRVLIAELPELGKLNHKEISGLCGLAPHARESGQWRGKRTTRGGRARVRTALYMAALVGAKHNPVLKDLYQRLVKAGKAKKVALIACAHKLLVMLNAMMKNNTTWNPPVRAKNA